MKKLKIALIILIAVAVVSAALVGITFLMEKKAEENKTENLLAVSDEDRNTPAPGEETEEQKTAETILVMFKDSSDNTIGFEAFFNIDFENNTITVISAESDISAVYDDGEFSYNGLVSDLLKKTTGEKAKAVICSCFGTLAEDYIVLDYDSLATLINSFTSRDGGFSFSAGANIEYTDKSGNKVSLPMSTLKYAGAEAKKLCQFEGYDDGVYGESVMSVFDGTELSFTKAKTKMVVSFLGQRLMGTIDEYYENYYESFVSSAINSCEKSEGTMELIKKFIENHKNFNADNISCYTAEVTRGEFAGQFVYSGKVITTDKNKELTEEETKKLFADLY